MKRTLSPTLRMEMLMAWGKEKPMIRMSLILMIRVSLGSRIFIVNRGSQSPRLAIIVTTAYPLFRCLPCIIKNCYELNPLRSFVQLRYLYPTNTPHKCVVPKSLVVVRSASRSPIASVYFELQSHLWHSHGL